MKPSAVFDLGRDTSRMKPRDVARQNATVATLLERLFVEDKPFQLLADEVGMGKTFVALATVFSVLEHRASHPDLQDCADKILVVTPHNRALFQKWQREVGEFVRRCVPPGRRKAARHFKSVSAARLDELAAAMDTDATVIITHMGAFGTTLRHADRKRRLVLAALFARWGRRFPRARRERVLRTGPVAWPRNPQHLAGVDPKDLPLSATRVSQLVDALLDADEALGDAVLSALQASDPSWGAIQEQLSELYVAAVRRGLARPLPLVVVDEAHNWKNGPATGANGYRHFRTTLAPHTRRLLLLTATPFQLHPSELLALFKIAEDIDANTQIVKSARTDIIGPVLDASAAASRRFTRAWLGLCVHQHDAVDAAWHGLIEARERLREDAEARGVVDPGVVASLAHAATRHHDPDLRELLRTGLRLFAFNRDLSQELGAWVIRHRRPSEHRMFLVGHEFAHRGPARSRPDRHLLHAAPGLEVTGAGELPHYLLMRCVSLMKQGKGRTSLGSALTGCYSTLLSSAEGNALRSSLADDPRGERYLDLLLSMVSAEQDPEHPKVRAVVDAVVAAWERGEKTLIFCFRINTANRLHELIDARIRQALRARMERCIGTDDALRSLRARLSSRTADLLPIGLDRVIPSAAITAKAPIPRDQLRLTDAELTDLASLALRAGVDLLSDRIDRVFLHRATEHVLAKRLQHGAHPLVKVILTRLASEAWVTHPYGTAHEEESTSELDDRGVHTAYELAVTADPAQVQTLADALRARRERGRLLDQYADGPNLWLDGDADVVQHLHDQLWRLCIEGGALVWRERLEVMAALRRALRWDGVLLRLLPERAERQQDGWADLLVRAFHAPLPGQTESMAARFGVFLEDLASASGQVWDVGTARGGLFAATELRGDRSPVALVKGGDGVSRDRVLAGFNTPLLPEVLVCTSVGQEGIDLHRHCRYVVHYDLAWNPAVIEQRTGRVDRLGSKTFRERAHAPDTLLEVGVPFLAGTYDERMYEELRLRAQTFEVLTGGELSGQHDEREGNDDEDGSEGATADWQLMPLPPEMVTDLRVDLQVTVDP